MKPARHVLLVDDCEDDVEVMLRTFARLPRSWSLTVAHSGRKALDCLNRRGEFADSMGLDLILLDINMPAMNGIQFLETAKQDQRFRSIPIIMFTSSALPSDLLNCYCRHANCYVVKPVDSHAFGKLVEQLLTFWLDVVQLPPRP